MKLVVDSKDNTVREEGVAPIFGQFDVAVVGAGMAGFSAAISAARCGVRVCLIERTQIVGGTAISGLMNLFYAPYRGLTGIGKELFERLRKKNAAIPGETVPFDAELCLLEMLDMLEESGVKLMLDTYVCGVVRDKEDICGVLVLNKSGFGVVRAERFVDASGDADLCAEAGYAYEMGREGDHLMRPMTLIFNVGGINVPRFVEYIQSHREQFAQDPNQCIVNMAIGEIRVFGFYDLVKEARNNGDLDESFHYFRIESVFVDRGIGTVNTTRVYHVDGTDAEDITKAVLCARKQERQLIGFMRKYVPGMENCYLLSSAPCIGVRDSRRVIGEYVMTEEDIAHHTCFDDCIGIGKNRQVLGPKGEGHSPDGDEGSERDSVNRRSVADYLEYQIPYRILIPKNSKRVLTAGKIVSCDIMANKHLRNQPPCMTTGQAAGVAAALSVKENVSVSQVNIRALQSVLNVNVVGDKDKAQ